MKKLISFIIAAAIALPIVPATMVSAATVEGWSVGFSNVVEGKDAEMKLVSNESASGSHSVFASFNGSLRSMYYTSLNQRCR